MMDPPLTRTEQDAIVAFADALRDGDPAAHDVRKSFDAAFDAASAAETRARLEGLTREIPVAPIRTEPKHAAVEAVETLVRERDQAVAAWRASEREVEMLRAQLASALRR